MEENTLGIIKKLSDEGLIKEISISVFKNNQKIKEFNKFDNNKNFHIFSAGKPFIAAVIWKLHDKKLLNFNDPIIKFWPEFGKNNKKI
ncbi:MAG: serine hydrolase [Dehalococcoidales bacterium]|nr:serine hydrolase [Dehalococcoidales bacterium]